MARLPPAVTASVDIVYPTARDEPAFEWFADALARQLGDGDDARVVVVDGRDGPGRRRRFEDAVAGRFAFLHVPAKPSPHQGPHRRTKSDCFAAASARNTGLVYATAPSVAFVDDCAVPMPGWWRAVRRAADDGAVVTGAYQRHWSMDVREGRLVSSRPHDAGLDSRWSQGDDTRPVPIGGAQLYSTTLCAPRELLLSVNGFDELCGIIAQEDWQLGLRLENAGVPMRYDRSMLIVESEELGRRPPTLLRLDPELSEAVYAERLAEFGVARRRTTGRFDATRFVIDVVLGTGSWATYGNYYWLADLTPDAFDATIPRFPERFWFDGRPLASIG